MGDVNDGFGDEADLRTELLVKTLAAPREIGLVKGHPTPGTARLPGESNACRHSPRERLPEIPHTRTPPKEHHAHRQLPQPLHKHRAALAFPFTTKTCP